ncbi:hypothetical protein HFD88_005925 [Aspergillus terreus]|nr:hypothetical protein HFD88_005925 [Aspergillus terreus]
MDTPVFTLYLMASADKNPEETSLKNSCVAIPPVNITTATPTALSAYAPSRQPSEPTLIEEEKLLTHKHTFEILSRWVYRHIVTSPPLITSPHLADVAVRALQRAEPGFSLHDKGDTTYTSDSEDSTPYTDTDTDEELLYSYAAICPAFSAGDAEYQRHHRMGVYPMNWSLISNYVLLHNKTKFALASHVNAKWKVGEVVNAK